MKLEKYKIKKHKFVFFWLCVAFLMGVAGMTKIGDLMVKTVEIEATVSKAYRTYYKTNTHRAGALKMNIEWVDLNGETQTEGSLQNRGRYEEGDTIIITVDEKTHSRRVYSKTANIISFVVSVLLCIGSLWLMKMFFTRDEYYGE